MGIDENIERLEKLSKVFSDTKPVLVEIEKRLREREEKRVLIDTLFELGDAVSKNIEDIDAATKVLESLASEAGQTLTPLDAGRYERAVKFAKSNLDQIGETLATATQVASMKFPLLRALLRSMANQYDDLLTILRLMPTPSAQNPQIDPGIGSDLELLRRKKQSAAAEVQRVKSRLQVMK